MSWGKDERDEPRSYHHGNLREALILAALELIAKKGAAGFTFADAARFAGSPSRRWNCLVYSSTMTCRLIVMMPIGR